jgi:endonuclease/exonuclease/phosphatase family metal-dependent hydrolase
MQFRVASYNLENMFTRPAAMSEQPDGKGQQAILDHARLNEIVDQPVYSSADKAELLGFNARYHFADLNVPRNTLVLLQKIRSQLFGVRNGELTVVANGRADWTGWFDLRRNDVSWEATFNTARVIAEAQPDILLCVEVEDRPSLKRFHDQVLRAKYDLHYRHIMVIDGNDNRGIDVGILSRFPISGVRSHVDDMYDEQVLFPRDCPEYAIALPNGETLVVCPNHFSSKRGGNTSAVQARRLAQGTQAAAIARRAEAEVSPYVLLGGDLNDTPDSAALAPILSGNWRDIQDHPSYPTDRPGTYGTGNASDKIDYLVMSPALQDHLVSTGIERRGSWHPNTWASFDTVTGKNNEASDHHLIWADFSF